MEKPNAKCRVWYGASCIDKADCLTAAVSKSRCVLAVVSPGFVVDECCLFCLETAVRDAEVDVVYVLYGGITSTDDRRLRDALSADVHVALCTSRRRFVSPLSAADLHRHRDAPAARRRNDIDVDQFLLAVRLAIPVSRALCSGDRRSICRRGHGGLTRSVQMISKYGTVHSYFEDRFLAA